MPTNTRWMTAVAVAALMLLPACVKKELYDAALSDLASRTDDVTSLTEQLEACQTELDETAGELSACAEQRAKLGVARDKLMAESKSLRDALEATGAEAADLEQSLAEANKALEQMRAREAAAEERNRIYAQLIDRFRAMIDAGTLDVEIDRGRIVIKLKQDILFESGSSTVGKQGKETLLEVSAALAEFPDRIFQVEGHTDNVPIQTGRFPSNWELSTARATSVVKILIEGGVAPTNLSSAGYGEFQPRATNDDDDGRSLNRRIEIVMLPNLQLLPDPQQPARRTPPKKAPGRR